MGKQNVIRYSYFKSMYVEAIKVICLYVISGRGITIIKKEIKMLLMNIAPRVADKIGR